MRKYQLATLFLFVVTACGSKENGSTASEVSHSENGDYIIMTGDKVDDIRQVSISKRIGAGCMFGLDPLTVTSGDDTRFITLEYRTKDEITRIGKMRFLFWTWETTFVERPESFENLKLVFSLTQRNLDLLHQAEKARKLTKIVFDRGFYFKFDNPCKTGKVLEYQVLTGVGFSDQDLEKFVNLDIPKRPN